MTPAADSRPDAGRACATPLLIDPEFFPVRTIFGIGRNYPDHVRELGNAMPGAPLVFLKPHSALLEHGGTILLPPESHDVQHELELVLLLGRGGRRLSLDQAWSAIEGYGVGLDVTARDLQRRAQAAGNPWTVAKGFDTFAPISGFVPAARVADPRAIRFELRVNGELRQAGNSADMLFDCGQLVAYLSTVFTLAPGDRVFTGSPKGVARIRAGDQLRAGSADLGVSLSVTAAPGASIG